MGARACLTTSCPLVSLWYLVIQSNLGICVGVLQTSVKKSREEKNNKRTVNDSCLNEKFDKSLVCALRQHEKC